MPLSDKNRKILWARSGNRCAVCRHLLVIERDISDVESVVGEECHIISQPKNGPRYDPEYPNDQIDELDNLILLCRIHHKTVDDQFQTYTAFRLREIKSAHEKWVEIKLNDKQNIFHPRIKRIKANIPRYLERIRTGAELFNLADGCHAQYQHHESVLNDSEIEAVGSFLQEFKDWMELGIDEPLECLRIKKRIDDMIKGLEAVGFFVLANVENQILEGGTESPADWRVLHLSVLRNTDPNIIHIDHAKI
jgi:hypothetical protein